MHSRIPIDVSSAAARRRFFLSRAARLNTRGAGSDMRLLMTLRRTPNGARVPETIFGDLPVFLVGALAAAVYAPERSTSDVDYFVTADRYDDARACLREAGWRETRTLTFPNAALGLYGSAWTPSGEGREIDLLTSAQAWVRDAFSAPPSRAANGERVIPLPYLVLMKLDSARAIDQADLARILGRLSSESLDEVIRTVERHYRDPSAADDLRQYHELGKWEYESDMSSSRDPECSP